MKNTIWLGLIILVMLLIAAPVTAWNAEVTKSGPSVVCDTCEFYDYAIGVDSNTGSTGESETYLVRIVDVIPNNIDWVSGGIYDPGTRTVTFDFYHVPNNTHLDIVLRVKPNGAPGPVSNQAISFIKEFSDEDELTLEDHSPFFVTELSHDICGTPTPEFPTIAVPAALIVGILGAVLFIRRTKEN